MAIQNRPTTIAGTIYRPFFLAGIATVLTLGCVWGAINLFTIGVKENFRAISYSWVLAHGHAMVFGFVGLFIMGFAYQVVPRFKQTSLWRPRLAFSSLPLMIVGILLQTVAHLWSPPSLSLAILASAIQLAAVTIFCVVMVQTIRAAGKHEVYDRFLYAALVWYLIAAIANPVIFKLFELSGTREELLFNLATFNIPYRDVQLLGLAVVMILGISLRFLPHAYGFREPSRQWASLLFWGLNGAIAGGIGLGATIVGALAGGAIAGRIGIIRSLWVFGGLQAVSNLMYYLLAVIGKSYSFLVATMIVENFCTGLVTAGFLAFLMSMCSVRFSATQFALLSSLMAASRDIIIAPAGGIAAAVGWPTFFIITLLAGIPGLLLLPVFAPWNRDRPTIAATHTGATMTPEEALAASRKRDD